MEKFEEFFSLNDMTDSHKKLVEDIIHYLSKNKDNTLEKTVEELKIKYDLDDSPIMNTKDSLWHQLTDDVEDIGYNVVGLTIKNVNGKNLKIPYINVSGDLIAFDNMLGKLRKKFLKMEEMQKQD